MASSAPVLARGLHPPWHARILSITTCLPPLLDSKACAP